MQKKRDFRKFIYIVPGVVIAAVIALAVFLFGVKRGKAPSAEPVVIAVPYSEWVLDYETNYYTGWLEEKTGYDITFVYLDEGYERESIGTMLTSKSGSVDAIFLPMNQKILSFEEYQDFVKEGLLAAPRDYLSPDSNLRRIPDLYPEVYVEKILGEDGKAYCFPSVDMARTGRNAQILWINIDWLTELNLTMPRTAQEFKDALEAFQNGDPNGNGIADELPLVSCEAESCFKSYEYLLNAFTYYDSENLSWYVKDGKPVLALEQEGFREGIAYCADLYGQGLLAGDCFGYTQKQLMELVNDPADTVGAFTSHSIADVVYASNPGILAHFVQLAPLSSDTLAAGYAVRAGIHPSIGGLIPAGAAHKEAAAQIMDLMLSEEASLIALYGEKGTDWRFSSDGELSTYGTRALVTTIHYLKGERQNRNYAGAGPLVAASGYTDGVTWNGDHSMTEYIDARAVKAYEVNYYPETDEDRAVIDGILSAMAPERKDALTEYLEKELPRFITGERDVGDDADWEKFLAQYRRLLGQ